MSKELEENLELIKFYYEDIKKGKRFRIYPSRRRTKKQTDPEQLRIFEKRQKRLPDLWRKMGIVSWKLIQNPINTEEDIAKYLAQLKNTPSV